MLTIDSRAIHTPRRRMTRHHTRKQRKIHPHHTREAGEEEEEEEDNQQTIECARHVMCFVMRPGALAAEGHVNDSSAK